MISLPSLFLTSVLSLVVARLRAVPLGLTSLMEPGLAFFPPFFVTTFFVTFDLPLLIGEDWVTPLGGDKGFPGFCESREETVVF